MLLQSPVFQVKYCLLLGILLLLINVTTPQSTAYRRNGEPVNINWVWSLPWDVSNMLRAPLGGPFSLILSSGLAIIMFFGMIVSPVYYLLGTPTRKYHQNDAIINHFTDIGKKRDSSKLASFLSRFGESTSQLSNETMFGGDDLTNANSSYYSSSSPSPLLASLSIDTSTRTEAERMSERIDSQYPEFADSVFWLIGEENEECRKLMVCHAHGFFNFLPEIFLSYYRIFSSKMIAIPEDYQKAIKVGMEDQSLCMPTYTGCPNDIVTITKNTIRKTFMRDFSGVKNYFSSWLSHLTD